MDLTWIILGTLLTVVLAACANQVAHEFRAWAPWIIKRLIRYAVLGLPEASRERYQEEWSSAIGEVPGDVGKIFEAIGLLFASKRMAAELRAASTRRATALQLTPFDTSDSAFARRVHALERDLARERELGRQLAADAREAHSALLKTLEDARKVLEQHNLR